MSIVTYSVIAHAVLLFAAAPAARPQPTEPAPTGTWRFRVLLGDREIGSHVFRVEGDGAARTVSSEARFTVSFLFLTAYRYAHTASERWAGRCLLSLEARTQEGGRRRAVAARRGDGTLEVTADGKRTTVDERCPMTFAYWDPAILGQRWLLNAQTGRLEAVRVDTLGVETVRARGAEVRARRYALAAGDYRIDLWYDVRSGEWVRLETQARGRTLSYVLE